MKFSFNLRKRFGRGDLTPEQESVLDRLEKGEISDEEAEGELGGEIRVFDFSIGKESEGEERAAGRSEEEIARELVERISREVDDETKPRSKPKPKPKRKRKSRLSPERGEPVAAEQPVDSAAPERSEDEIARELVERISRDVDDETR